jgi:hypothetical protein
MRRTFVCSAWTGEGHYRIIWARGIRSLAHHAQIRSSGRSRLLQDLQPSPILNELSHPPWTTACVPVQPPTNWSAAASFLQPEPCETRIELKDMRGTTTGMEIDCGVGANPDRQGNSPRPDLLANPLPTPTTSPRFRSPSAAPRRGRGRRLA